MSGFLHAPHPHLKRRQETGPAKTAHAATKLGDRIGLKITAIVGTMICALVFSLIALVALPAAIKTGDTVVIVAWASSQFAQLVLLPVIIVGQNVQAAAADKRSQSTFDDAEAILHEALELQRHLEAQDAVLAGLIEQLKPGGA